MSQVYFYRLEVGSFESVLPRLLQKVLERGWFAVVQAVSPEVVKSIDSVLWTYSADSFLPHSADMDFFPSEQPVFLTSTLANPNESQVRFFLNCEPEMPFSDYERLVCIFDNFHEERLSVISRVGQKARSEGHEVICWVQTEKGKWVKGD
ncbi:MAG: DNA polymerase III subunit chi [Alphaproteobacteria bacterium]|nr:DNA polymerase III subunit chi [Alphaproteobacteria bacterium]